jgi:hypothetical protein
MILTVGYQNKKGTKSLRAKTWMIMKLTIVFLLFFTFQVSANGYAQRITIVKKNVHLADVFKSIERQTGFLFIYDRALIQNTEPIDDSVKNATLEQTLHACLKDQQLTYSIVRNTIVIQSRKRLPSHFYNAVVSVIPDPPAPPPIQIHGSVKDENGNPLSNASVTIKGTNQGVTTNALGDFDINIPRSGTVLVISYTGYISQEIRINDRTAIVINLVKMDNSLNAVVVVGYGSQKKSDLTGAVGVISVENMKDRATVNFGEAMAGQLAGVQVQQINGAPRRRRAYYKNKRDRVYYSIQFTIVCSRWLSYGRRSFSIN